MPAPIPIRLAQTLGITTSLLMGSFGLSFSIFTVPRLLESPTPLMLRQWRKMYIAGKHAAIPLAFLSSLSYFFLAYKSHTSNPFAGGGLIGDAGAYGLAGVLCGGIIPVTFAVLMPTNKKLEEKEEETRSLVVEDKIVEVGVLETAHVLVDRWATLNLIRVGMLFAAGVIGIWTSIGN